MSQVVYDGLSLTGVKRWVPPERGGSTFVFHASRHTYATRAIQAGVNIRVLQKLISHKIIQATLRYAHVDDETLSDAALKALDFHASRHQRAAAVG